MTLTVWRGFGRKEATKGTGGGGSAFTIVLADFREVASGKSAEAGGAKVLGKSSWQEGGSVNRDQKEGLAARPGLEGFSGRERGVRPRPLEDWLPPFAQIRKAQGASEGCLQAFAIVVHFGAFGCIWVHSGATTKRR